jgi:hypothetical protein
VPRWTGVRQKALRDWLASPQGGAPGATSGPEGDAQSAVCVKFRCECVVDGFTRRRAACVIEHHPLSRQAQFRAGCLLAATLALAAVQSCGVWSSTGDCTERATCSEVQDGTKDSVSTDASQDRSPGVNPETGSGARDGSVAIDGEVLTPDAGASDVNLDAANRDAPTADVANDRSAGWDASIDGVDERAGSGDATQDVAARDGPSGACVPTGPEDCTNGVDDDCNGKIDCADPACGAYACAASVPSGWLGPVAFWQAASSSAPPSCLPPFGSPIDGSEGLSASPATCTCACTASGQACSATGVFHADQACASGACATVTPAPSGACTAVPANACGSGGSFSVSGTPTPSGGSCTAQVTPAIPPASWTTSARACLYGGPTDSPGGCSASQQCVAAPASPYGPKLCVYSAATPPPSTCPAGYNANTPAVLYSGFADTRDCGGCTCGGPSGGSCAGTISLYGRGGCAGSSGAATYTLGTTCQAYMGLSPVPGSVRAQYAVTAGSCSVTSQPMPNGAASPTGPLTVCCM